MPRRAGTSVYRISLRGAGRVAADFDRMARAVQDEIIASVRRLGADARDVFVGYAPEDTGDLRASIDAIPYFRAARPRVDIRVAPLRGHQGEQRDAFNYLDVTRRGHRRARLYPQRARALKVHIEGHREPHIFVFRNWVTGVGHPHPSELSGVQSRDVRQAVRRAARVEDWVVAAQPEVARAIDREQRALGRRIDARVLR